LTSSYLEQKIWDCQGESANKLWLLVHAEGFQDVLGVDAAATFHQQWHHARRIGRPRARLGGGPRCVDGELAAGPTEDSQYLGISIARSGLLPSVVYHNQALYTQPSRLNGQTSASGTTQIFIANNAVHEYASQASITENLGLAGWAGVRRADAASAVAAADSKAEMIARFAEDYVAKPYEYVELVARIRRALRRLQDQIPVEELDLGDVTLIPRKREAMVRGRRVTLSPIESRFLATLAASMPNAVTTERLLSKVWADSDAADPAYVWVTVRRLRQKLELDPDRPQHLLTATNGYRLEVARERS